MSSDRTHEAGGFIFTLSNGTVSASKDGKPVVLDRETENIVRSGFGLPPKRPQRLEELSIEVQQRYNKAMDIISGVSTASVHQRRQATRYVRSIKSFLRGDDQTP